MDIDSVPQQAMSTARSSLSDRPRESGRPPKIRSSCDACAKAKVKCDQARPACQRCNSAAVRCHYSLSRRVGKPPGFAAAGSRSDAKRATNLTPSGIGTPRSITSPKGDPTDALLDDLLNSYKVHQQPSDVSLGESSLDFGLGPSPPFLDLKEMSQLFGNPSGFSSTAQFLTPAQFSTPALPPTDKPRGFANTWPRSNTLGGGPFQSQEAGFSSVTAYDMEQFLSLHGSAGGLPVLPPGGPFRQNKCQTPARSANSPGQSQWRQACIHMSVHNVCCTVLAATTLRNLRLESEPGNEVFTTNRRAISIFHDVLRCPCSSNAENSALTLTLALIILNMLSSYTAIARCSSSSYLPSSASAAPATRASDKSMLQDVPLHSRSLVTTRAYAGAEDEPPVTLQLLLTQLRTVSELVDAFAARYTLSGSGEKALFSAVETLLRKEWQNALQEIVTICRGKI